MNIPLLNSHPLSQTDQSTTIKQKQEPSRASGILTAAMHLATKLELGTPLDARIMRTAMEEAFRASDTNGAWIWKDAYEATELSQIMMIDRYGSAMRRNAESDLNYLDMIGKIAALAPTHTRRSEEMVALQQFSTPLPYSALAAIAAEIKPSDTILEPSAGTGMLAIFGQSIGAKLHLNEFAENRRELLHALFPNAVVTGLDAAQINDRLDRSVSPSLILMNPPFSVANHVEGQHKLATANHVLSALQRLRNGGRMIAITGANFSPASKSFRSAFDQIKVLGSIVLSAPVSGRIFAKHGTTVETRLTVIDKYEIGNDAHSDENHRFFPLMESIEDLAKLIFDHVPPRIELSNHQPISSPASTLLKIRDAAREETKALAIKAAAHPFDSADIVDLAYVAQNRPQSAQNASESDSNTVYEEYTLQSIQIDGAGEHPTKLVQSAAMASVAPPLPKHHPKLLKTVIADNILSGPQLESVIYAGDAHNTHLKGWFKPSEIEGSIISADENDEGAFQLRRGWFLGDGTGCGKGRQVAGIIMDNWLHGRKRAVWVSKSDKLLEDAKRDWMAIGGRETDIVPLARFRQGKDIKLTQGILFVTYATLRSAERCQGDEIKASRLEQVIDWLGSGFNGVIAFDEGHAMANAASQKSERGDTKASLQGLAGLALQNRVPDARILYVSATGATVVSNLAYASRLGLWGTGDFAFKTRSEFIGAMEAGGIAAMEIISRDLKALGLYLARSLSYEGVEYDMLVHELTPAQIDIYDSYANVFQIIHNNLEKALEASGITTDEGTLNSQAKSAARSAFESNKQRFFNHLITAMKCPSVIKSIEQDIERGHSAVLQVVSTSEALMERRLCEIPASEWGDLHVDITPREYVMDYLMHSFPTQLFEPYTDEAGKMCSRPAVDENGNPIICRAAERRRDDLVERLGVLPPVQGALDQILWHFGADHVAEVTGRKRRIVKTVDGKMSVENRPGSSNISETHAFMDDKKRILIFSDAGGTGRSYHADLNVKNQRLRVHYLLEPGWKADNAIQGLGRTNRTNQAQPPLFRPTATNVKGEKRFLSTIARRLDTLGAITKGQRETGGQNMFRAEDNLESSYARAALRQFFYKLRAGQIHACSYQKFQEMTGLTLDDADGCMKEVLPPIQQFLNRCLALKIHMQDAIFEAFTGFLSALIEDARKSGTLDVGLETLRAEKFDIIDRRVVYEDPETGSETTALTIERTDRNHPLSFNNVRDFAQTTKGASLYWNKSSKRAALCLNAISYMSEEGVPIPRVELMRPMGSDTFLMTEFIKSNWEECTDQMFETLWNDEVAAVPEFTKSKITMICGLLLPIWDRLPKANMRIYRLETSDNERVLGRLITQEELITVYTQLGLDCELNLSADDVVKTVIDQRSNLTLLSGICLRRSFVMGQTRLELANFKSTELAELKQLGCFSEIIQWKTRLFIPMDDMAPLSKLLERDPVGRKYSGAA